VRLGTVHQRSVHQRSPAVSSGLPSGHQQGSHPRITPACLVPGGPQHPPRSRVGKRQPTSCRGGCPQPEPLPGVIRKTGEDQEEGHPRWRLQLIRSRASRATTASQTSPGRLAITRACGGARSEHYERAAEGHQSLLDHDYPLTRPRLKSTEERGFRCGAPGGRIIDRQLPKKLPMGGGGRLWRGRRVDAGCEAQR
jgi:hypothetical protein